MKNSLFCGRNGRATAWTHHPSRSNMAYRTSFHIITLTDWKELPRVLYGMDLGPCQSLSSKVCSDWLTMSAIGAGKVVVGYMPTICLCYSRSSLPTPLPLSGGFHSDLLIWLLICFYVFLPFWVGVIWLTDLHLSLTRYVSSSESIKNKTKTNPKKPLTPEAWHYGLYQPFRILIKLNQSQRSDQLLV